ncbi:hypothetical protein QC756_11555 [Sinorhizobium meliloti]|uniref:hypothetical protein n=1 Tax=Rhizobium meliloti TaxID=382 RepID=UPI00244E03A9|nr:hypothetical protein [Sinorhizobium meliloti]WGI73007.1 hypothetical protein QC756_11555 [Sinorhizobium meliloti]
MSDLLDLQAQATDKVTSGQVKAAIAAMHSPPSHQTFFEVSNATGYGIKSYADAISMGVWPSTGNEIHGFEVKVSRSDFLNEMKNPEKAMPIMQYCHRWSLVCPASMVKLDEVPATLGRLLVQGRRSQEGAAGAAAGGKAANCCICGGVGAASRGGRFCRRQQGCERRTRQMGRGEAARDRERG